MTFALISVLAALALLLALNWNQFKGMGAARVLRLVIIWGVIIAGLTLAVKLLGLA